MSSADSLDGDIRNTNRSYPYQDEFLQYYQKHRPPGAVPRGYNFERFCNMDTGGTASLSASPNGEGAERSQFSQYRQSDPQALNLTLSPSSSNAEEDDYEQDKTGLPLLLPLL